MRWNHLPVAGGLYDQSPELLAQFEVIFQERAAYEEQKRKKEEAKQRRGATRPNKGRRR